MQVTFYPKRLLITALSMVILWMLVSRALDSRPAGALTLATIVAAGVFFNLFFFVNPALWGRWRRTR